MSRQLREIERRRIELASLSRYERWAIAENRLWSSLPFVLAELALDAGKAVGIYLILSKFQRLGKK
jgi:hypothetical protein